MKQEADAGIPIPRGVHSRWMRSHLSSFRDLQFTPGPHGPRSGFLVGDRNTFSARTVALRTTVLPVNLGVLPIFFEMNFGLFSS